MKKIKKIKIKNMSIVLLLAVVFGIINADSTRLNAKNGMLTLQGESIYKIMTDRFYDGDLGNNARGNAFRFTEKTEDDFRYMHGGDWKGIIEKIPYIKGMGFISIWISPITDPQLWSMPDQNGKQWPTAYYGYNVHNPNRASRYFGTENPEESKKNIKKLVDECHKNGLKVILDIVPNHVGDYLQGKDGNAHYISNSQDLFEIRLFLWG